MTAGSIEYAQEAVDCHTDGDEEEGLAITCPNGCTSYPAESIDLVYKVLAIFCPDLEIYNPIP